MALARQRAGERERARVHTAYAIVPLTRIDRCVYFVTCLIMWFMCGRQFIKLPESPRLIQHKSTHYFFCRICDFCFPLFSPLLSFAHTKKPRARLHIKHTNKTRRNMNFHCNEKSNRGRHRNCSIHII